MGIGYPSSRRARTQTAAQDARPSIDAVLLALATAGTAAEVGAVLVEQVPVLLRTELVFLTWSQTSAGTHEAQPIRAGDERLALSTTPAVPLIVSKRSAAPDVDPALSTTGTRQLIAAPMGADGYLVAARRGGKPLRQPDLEMLARIGAHAAAALQRAGAADQMRAALDQARNAVGHDPLTGLAGRALFEAHVRDAEGPLALFLLDLGGLIEINEALGHSTGDVVLKLVAQRLVRELPNAVAVARVGGTQFAFALHVTTRHQALGFARRVQEVVSAPFLLPDIALEVEAVVGVAITEGRADAAALIEDAGAALRGARRRHVVVEHHDGPAAHDGGLVPGALREAVRHGGLAVEYQPIVDLQAGDVAAFESLVRWQHPARGLVPPDEFLPRVELIGLSPALTSVVLAAALERCRQWRTADAPAHVAINISARALHDARLPDTIVAALDRVSLPASSLTLEIGEAVAMAAPARTRIALQRLAAKGVRLALDDVGTGFSSLPLLRTLPLDELKIDRALIAACTTDRDAAAVVQGIIAFAERVGRSVVAEGVEDEPTFRRLRDVGCSRAQGYWIGRPMHGDAISDWNRTWAARFADGTITL